MSDPVQNLLNILDLERLELDLFRGVTDEMDAHDIRVFGGQVIAQSLVAAYRTVEDRACHSLHAYFIRPGDPKLPIIYEVDRSRDGGSFATRRVIAIQNGKQIFNMAASFHRDEEGWNHQHDMPSVEGPENLPSFEKLRLAQSKDLPESKRDFFLKPRPIEMRELDPMNLLQPEKKPDASHVWMRTAREIDEAPWVHHCLLAYASDMRLLGTAHRPHGVSWMTGEVMGASLDHSMWFHAPVKFDDWLLYAMDSPYAGGARSFNRGKIFTRDGTLVASVAQ
ncbi:MAG: acyl-CoA thioesterase II, partial [Pseudomonadota bacterium]